MTKWSKKEVISEIIDKYITGEYTMAALGREYGLTQSGIAGIMRRNKINTDSTIMSRLNRIYNIDHKYFNIINERSAYYLGLLYADGSNDTEKSYIRLGLQERDRDILDKFKIDIQSDKPLYFVKSKSEKVRNTYILSISSREMSNRLEQLGCHKNKMYTLKFPTEEQVPEKYIRHFLRGMWDGDGSSSLHIDNKNKMRMTTSLTGTFDICNNISKTIRKYLDVSSSIHAKPTGNGVHTIFISGPIAGYKFFRWLYKDSDLWLERKYNKFLDQSNKIKERMIVSYQLRNALEGIL